MGLKTIRPKRPIYDARGSIERAKGALGDYSDLVLASMRRYPAQRRGLPARFQSEKSRRYFFWALRNGKISVPYSRTMRLRGGWVLQPQQSGDEFRIRILNSVPYAGGVQGDQQWASMRERDWPRLSEVVRGEWQKARPKLRAAFKRT